MENAYCLYGTAPVIKKMKVGATVNVGVMTLENAAGGLLPCTTTSAVGSYGVSLDTGTYTTTQGDTEGVVSLDIRPHNVIRARMSGGATEGTDLTTLSNTAAESAGTTITDADTGSADMDSGSVWRLVKGDGAGNQTDESRIITTHNSATDFVVTVPFLQDIAAADEFLFCPWSIGTDGNGNVQTSTAFTEADATIASGTGTVAAVVEIIPRGAGNSYVDFLNGDHALNFAVT